MANTLQELRKEAGYRTAKDFAVAVDIPAPTYTRYEQDQSKIPVERAWIIADKLECSIDAVVGREHIEVSEMRGPVQRFYDELSDEGQEMMNSYMEFVEYKEVAEAQRRQDEEDRKYDQISEFYDKLFIQSLSEDPDYADEILFVRTPDLREAYREFVHLKTLEKRDQRAKKWAEGIIRDTKAAGTYYIDEGVLGKMPDDPGYDEAFYLFSFQQGAMLWETIEGTVDDVVDKIMAGYDRHHPEETSVARRMKKASQAAKLGKSLVPSILAEYGNIPVSALRTSGGD